MMCKYNMFLSRLVNYRMNNLMFKFFYWVVIDRSKRMHVPAKVIAFIFVHNMADGI